MVIGCQENPADFFSVLQTKDLAQINAFINYKKNQNKFDDIKNGFFYFANAFETFQPKEKWYKIAQLLIDSGIDINYKNNDGETALMLLCRHHAFGNVLQLLIDFDIDINLTNNEGDSALLIAAQCVQSDTVFLLLINDADAQIINNKGERLSDFTIDKICYDWDGSEAWRFDYSRNADAIERARKYKTRQVLYDTITTMPDELIDIINEY